MAEGNFASRSRHEARERIRLITEELARRSRTENLKAEAGALRDRVTAQAKAKAQEKTDEFKARAKEAARVKALNLRDQVKEQMMAKPVALGILGGVAGAVVGALLGRRAEESQHYVRAGSIETTGVGSRWEQRRAYDIEGGAPYYGEREVVYDEATARGFPHVEGEEAGRMEEMKGRVSGAMDQGREKVAGAVDQAREKAEDLKERARDVKDRAMGAVGDVKERIGEKMPSMEGVKGRADSIVREDPMMLAFGAMAFGAFLGLVMPLSDTERRTLRGAHLKAKEQLRTGVERAQEMISERAGAVVPTLLGVKQGEKHEERHEEFESHEEREAGEDLRASANPDAFEPPAIH